MSPLEQYMQRLAELRKPKRATMSFSPTPDATMAPQGPTPEGGILGQSRAATAVPGRRRFSIGNASRGSIDLGTILSARENPDAVAQLAANPMADVDRFKPTTGFGGFFRSLLGDDANERNDAARADREQLLRRNWLAQQEIQGRVGLAEKEHQFGLERINTEGKLRADLAAQQDQTALQRLRMQDQNAFGLEGMRAVNELIKQNAGQQFTAGENRLNRAVTERGQDMSGQNAQLRYLLAQRERGNKLPNDWAEINGQIFMPNDEGRMIPFNPDVAAGPKTAADFNNANTAALVAQAQEQAKLAELNAPPSVMGGAKALGGEAVQGALDLGKGAFNTTFPNVAPAMNLGKETVSSILNYLRNKDAAEKQRKLQLLQTNAVPAL